MVVTLRAAGAAPLAAALAAAPRVVSAAAAAAMQRSLLLVEAGARTHVPQDTRQLMGSLHSTIRETPGARPTLVGTVGPAARYGAYVEFGTRPHWPPRAPLEGWARRHHLPVFLVQRAIARRGTRKRPFLAPALERNQARIVALFAAAGEVVSSSITRAAAAGGRREAAG